jgi:hypothetical protein
MQVALVRLPRHDFDDGAEETVPGVGVAMVLAGRRQEGRGEDSRHVLIAARRCVVVFGVVAAEAGGVGQQLVQGDARLVGRHLRKEAAERIARGEPPILLEPENRRGGELLGDRAEAHQRRHIVGEVALPVALAVAPGQDDLAAPGNQHGAAESGRGETAEAAVEPSRERPPDDGGVA